MILYLYQTAELYGFTDENNLMIYRKSFACALVLLLTNVLFVEALF